MMTQIVYTTEGFNDRDVITEVSVVEVLHRVIKTCGITDVLYEVSNPKENLIGNMESISFVDISYQV